MAETSMIGRTPLGQVVAHLVLAAGAVVMWRRRRPLLPLLVFPVIVVFAVAVQYGYTRYRAPAEVAIVCFRDGRVVVRETQ